MIGRTIGAAGFDTTARRPGTAAASEPPPNALTRNAHEREGVAEQKDSQGSIGIWGGRHLHFLHHLNNEFLEFSVEQALKTCCQ